MISCYSLSPTDLFLMRADSSHLERLTLKQGDNEKPVWSPDGRFLMFQSNRTSQNSDTMGPAYQFYVMSPNGGNAKPLSYHSVQDMRQPAWSPRVDLVL